MPRFRSSKLRLFLLAAATLAAATAVLAAGKEKKPARPARVEMIGPTQVVNVTSFTVSPPLGSVVGIRSSDEFPPGQISEIPLRSLGKQEKTQKLGMTRAEADGALQLTAPRFAMPSPSVSFEGLNSQDNQDNLGFRVYPPDTNGVVGPNHYVQMVNLLVRIYDKAGTPLTAPFTLSSFFAACGCQCGLADNGDPVVVYDQLADRWILSQFGFASSSSPPYYECIAVSTTNDPTGSYYVYDFLTPGNEFPDYPKLGVWPDGYYMTTNQFYNGGAFDGAGVFAFDRAKMLAGDPSASLIYFDLNLSSFPEGIGGMLPSNLDGITPPPAGAPNVFAYFTANEWGDPADGLRLFDFHVDWAVPANSTFIERSESSYASPVAVAAFNPLTPAGRDNILQPPPSTTSTALDAISDRLMHRLQYRNFGSHQSLVVSHTVNVNGSTTLGTYRAGVRYYELRSAGGAYSVNEQGTFAPTSLPGGGTDTAISRWMGSAAMDASGNLAVGYSASSVNTYPSIWYAGRLAGDPAGTLGQGEAVLVNGTGVQLGSASRWGDYSAMTVDPADDCSFWYTTEYYTAASQASSSIGWLTRIGKFSFGASCTPPQHGTLVVNVTNCGTAAPVPGASITVGGTMYGVTGAGGSFSAAVPPGNYQVTVSAPSYSSATTGAAVTNGNTTTLNLCLNGMPIITASGTSLVSETCAPPDGQVDPGEVVTLAFSLTNTGTADTANLVATLQVSGGVTAPSGPQNYGTLSAGGPSVSRNFTFTADGALACGDTITATLQLQDGASNLGTVSFPISTGVLATPFSENFDGVTAPALPAGWTASNASGAALWVTSAGNPDTAPNSAFVDDPSTISDKRLDTPSIAVATASAQLSFRNYYNLETNFDGGVLEISIGGGPFTDILAAGGSFVTGGYVHAISSSFSNPLAGRSAWTGNAGGYINTVVNLPAAAAGQNVVLRFRMGSDTSVSAAGWRVDGVVLTDGYTCCIPCSALTLAPAALPPLQQGVAYSQQITASGGTGPYTFAVTGGSLPAGLTLSSGGLLSGTPTASGGYSFTVTATDANGCTGEITYAGAALKWYFLDDNARSKFCFDTVTGTYVWNITSGPENGTTLTGAGKVFNAGAKVTNLPGDPNGSFSVTYDAVKRKASGWLITAAGHYVALSDANTANNPGGCN